jgi:hypothetical protein
MTLRSAFTQKLIGKGRLSRAVKARRMRKEKARRDIEARQKKFAKEFGSSPPKQFDIKPDLPTRGSKKRRRFF